MIKNTVLQHKKEQEYLLSNKYIPREKLDFAKKFLAHDIIKVITGPRRAGKSVLAMLLLKEKNFVYLNFDDENLLNINNTDEIIEGIFQVWTNPEFILFDEIQNLMNWELFVNKLKRRGYNLVLTGSNAKLLSKELSTVLTGRHIPIELFPFNFKEFLVAKNFELKEEESGVPEIKGRILNYLSDYLINGGYPEVVVKKLDTKTYLDTLADAILLKDVVKRYNVRFSQKIYELFLYLSGNFSGEYSFNKLKNILNFNSVNTIQNYISYLEEAYLIFSLNRFSFKLKEQIRTTRKIYLVDNGFVLAKSFQFSQNTGKLMENLVFGELLKRGYMPNGSLFYYKTRNQKEVDFLLKESTKITSLIQVSYLEEDTLEIEKREIKALIEASQELCCDDLSIITWDKEGEKKTKGKIIKLVPLWKWLMKKQSLF